MSFSWLLLNTEEQEFLLKQREIREQTYKQYALLNELNSRRSEALLEFLGNVYGNNRDPLEQLAITLKDELDFLQLNWQVEQVWLLDTLGKTVFPDIRQLPEHIRALDDQIRTRQRSVNRVFCADICTQLLGVPLLIKGEMASVIVTLSLSESLAFLGQSSGARLALVSASDSSLSVMASELRIKGQHAASSIDMFNRLLSQLPDTLTVGELEDKGYQVAESNQAYLLVLIPMSEGQGEVNFVLSAHNITPLVESRRQYQVAVVVIGTIFYGLCCLIFYGLTNGFRRRLLNISKRLPLLAEGGFREFHAQRIPVSTRFRDELDILQESATRLANKLEILDGEVRDKTGALERIAMYDSLTQLPNRNMLTFQLTRALADLDRRPGYVAILFFDLDDFKKVNDSHGHSAGDALLVEASSRLASLIRKSDLACRFGGDEFVVMLSHIDDLNSAITVAGKILDAMREPISVESSRFYVSTSIGLAATQDSEFSVDELISHADIAMYQAKNAGGNCIKLFDQQMSSLAKEKVTLETAARDALSNDQFQFALQPQVELETGRLVGFEALLRWIHPERGFISPSQFIPVLENTEFMLNLGYWCIDRACQILKTLEKEGYGDMRIAINLAAIQFLDPELIPYLNQKLAESGLKAEKLELELTERTLVSDVTRTTDIMDMLINLGFIISIDDFGTGYSSLSYLKRMPAHVIKIDRSFISGMVSSNADRQIVASTISMVKNLGMTVIAEGIENASQMQILKELGCDIAQGFYIARPIMESHLNEAMRNQFKAGYWQIQQPADGTETPNISHG